MLQEVNNFKQAPSPRSPLSSQGAQEASQRVLKRYRKAKLRRIQRKEYLKLRAIVPAVACQEKVSKVTVIEEAIKYIDELHQALTARLQQGQLSSPNDCSSFLTSCQSTHQLSTSSPFKPHNSPYGNQSVDRQRHHGNPVSSPSQSSSSSSASSSSTSYQCNFMSLASPLHAINRLS